MKYFEFGQQNETLMVLLHGGGVCYRGVLPVAERLSKDFHVLVVAYDGFNPTEPDTEFVSVMDEAKRLGDYIVEHHGGKLRYGKPAESLKGEAGSGAGSDTCGEKR